MASTNEIEAENRKIAYLRWVVDIGLLEIRSGSFTIEQARELESQVKRFALRLFPGSGDTFDLIYVPRFRRAMAEKYGSSDLRFI